MRYIGRVICFGLVLLCFSFSTELSADLASDTGDLMMGAIPLGRGSAKANIDICPMGAQTIGQFLYAWDRDDYQAMYDLIDDDSKKEYPFSKARFDLQFMEFKPYKISSVRQEGVNFEFFLSYGDYQDGDKDLKKITISGITYKIILSRGHSVFKKSADSYF